MSTENKFSGENSDHFLIDKYKQLQLEKKYEDEISYLKERCDLYYFDENNEFNNKMLTLAAIAKFGPTENIKNMAQNVIDEILKSRIQYLLNN